MDTQTQTPPLVPCPPNPLLHIHWPLPQRPPAPSLAYEWVHSGAVCGVTIVAVGLQEVAAKSVWFKKEGT